MHYIATLILKFSYFLDSSKWYQHKKEFARKLLEYQNSTWKFYFDIFMVILVVVSVFILLYEVKNSEENVYLETFIEFSLVVFIIEYLCRLWIFSDSHKIILSYYQQTLENHTHFSLIKALGKVIRTKLAYIFSPLAIIDLLAILPSYRPLRFLRIFLLFRIFKLFRYAKSMKTFTAIIVEKKFELLTLATFASFIVFAGSSAIYIFETHHNPKINTLYDALYWSIVTMGTVGYGDIVPVTHEGMAVAMVLIVVGIATLAFLTSIIVSSFQTKIAELKENRLYLDIEKMRDFILICGYGRVGEVLAKMLHDDGYPIVILDNNPAQIALALSRGYVGIIGDASKNKLLEQVGIKTRASKVICVTNSDEMNVFITLTARSLNPHLEIIARVVKKQNKKKYFLAGATFAFSVDETIGLMGREFIEHPISYAALDEILTENIGVLCESITLHPHSIFVHKTLHEFRAHAKHLLIYGILRHNKPLVDGTPSCLIEEKHFYFNPPDSFELKSGDCLIVMGRKIHIKQLQKLSDKGQLK